jgi:hypothetical protein
MYDPVIGRFTTPDSIIPDVYDPQGLNPYAYCYNSPLVYVDPSGNRGENPDDGDSYDGPTECTICGGGKLGPPGSGGFPASEECGGRARSGKNKSGLSGGGGGDGSGPKPGNATAKNDVYYANALIVRGVIAAEYAFTAISAAFAAYLYNNAIEQAKEDEKKKEAQENPEELSPDEPNPNEPDYKPLPPPYTGRKGRHKNDLEPDPNAQGPHTTYKRDQDGNITNYKEWDGNGHPVKEVDITGSTHGGIKTPHTHEYGPPNIDKTGKPYPGNKLAPRPSTPDEITKRR